jgi:hypothetical protein
MMIRRGMKVAAILSLTLGFSSPSFAQSPSDWKPLFDGKSLDGWDHVGPGRFVVEGGQLRTEGGMGLLWYSRQKLGDCVIRVVYRLGTEKSNSGVYIRIAEKPADPWYAVHHGFEVQIADGGRSERGTGSIYTFAGAKAQPSKPPEAGYIGLQNHDKESTVFFKEVSVRPLPAAAK